MVNIQLIQIEILNQIINYIDEGDTESARTVAEKMRNTIQDDIDKIESDAIETNENNIDTKSFKYKQQSHVSNKNADK
jgi:hypothetical protein